MNYIIQIFVFRLLLAVVTVIYGEVEIITAPKPGQEYVFVQTSGSGARPISRKDKQKNIERPFETAHKLPQTLTFALNDKDEYTAEKTKQKRSASPGDAPAPAPAGAIKLDPLKLIEKYKTELKASTTVAPKTSTTSKSPRRGQRTTKSNKRTKKEAPVTNPTPILTTAKASPRSIDVDDVPLVASGSEKQRSRIQIKKGPNGQEYEYEYVYYYYDDDDNPKAAKENVNTNAHDGPARNQVSSAEKPKTGEKSTPEPASNEVVPLQRGARGRGRQLDGEDQIGEERLPANTRFPPRSRNLATTPAPEEDGKTTLRSRPRIRTTTDSAVSTEADSFSEETQVSLK